MDTGTIIIDSGNKTPDVLAHEILHWMRFDTVSAAEHGTAPTSRDLVFACGMVGFTPASYPLDKFGVIARQTCQNARVVGGRIVLR
jgi:hypothetical protein